MIYDIDDGRRRSSGSSSGPIDTARRPKGPRFQGWPPTEVRQEIYKDPHHTVERVINRLRGSGRAHQVPIREFGYQGPIVASIGIWLR
jgi:hypothetical protein